MMAVWEEAFGGETDWILKVVLGLSQAREGSHWGPGTVPSKGAGPGPVHATSRAPYLQPPRQTEALLATARHLQSLGTEVPGLYWVAWNNIGPGAPPFQPAEGLVFTG